MSVSGSGMFVANFVAALNASQLALDFSLTTNKVALFTNAITPDYSASAANAAYGAGQYATNEVNGTGYAAGGLTVTSPTITESPAGTLKYAIASPSWATSTITNARCALLYMPTLTPKAAIVLVDFGADYSTVAGTFLFTVSASGILTLDLVP